MKHLKTIFACLLMAVLSIGQVWADPAAVGTTLFSENFGGYSADDVPSGSVSSSTGNRVIYGGGSVTYTSEDNGTNKTKIYSANLAGGTSPELLVGKSGGVFTITGIPSGDAQEITVSFKQNAQKLTISLDGTGYSTEYASPKPAAAGTVSFDITVADGADATFTLIMSAGSSNVRVDDILITVKTAGEGAGTPKTLTGVAVSGTPTKTVYNTGDNFDPTGLTVTGTYSDASTAPISSGITWAYTPSQTLALNQTSIGVTATVSEITSAEYNVTGLTVSDPVVSSWQVIAPADLVTGDMVVLTMLKNAVYYAAPNNGGNSAPTATAVTVVGDKLSNEPAATLQWEVTVVSAGVYQFSVGENYLKCTDTNNGVKVGTGDYNTFDVVEENEKFYLHTTETMSSAASGRYLGIYNTQDWRCYGSVNNNIKDGSLVIFKDASAAATVAKPTISGDENFVTSTTVTLACSTTGAEIYYTTDGSDPKTSGSIGTSFSLTETKTVRAIAKLGSDWSAEATPKTFTKVTPMTTAAELRSFATSSAQNAFIQLDGWKVTFVNGNNAYMIDPSNEGVILNNASHGYVAGDELNDEVVEASVKLASGRVQLSGFTSTDITATAGTVSPTEITDYSTLTSAHQSRLVTLKDATYSSSDGTFSDGANVIYYYDQFSASPTLVDAATYDVTGVVIYYKNNTTDKVQVAPRTDADVEAKGAVVIPTAANLAALKAADRGTYILTLTNAVISFVNGKNAFIEDATGGALIFFQDHGFTAGDCLNGDYQVVTTDYQGKFEITAMDPQAGAATTTAAIPLTTVSIATLNANFGSYESMRVKIVGANVTDAISGSDRNGAINDGAALAVYAGVASTITLTADDNVDIIGYPGFHNTDQQLTVWQQSDITVNEKDPAGIAFTPESETITGGDPWSAPAFANPNSLTVTFSGDNDAVATVNTTTGEIALAGGYGTAVITAHTDGDATHNAGNATYTITVNDPSSVDTRKVANGPAAFTTTNGFLTPSDILFISHKGGAATAPAIYNDGIRLYQISGTNAYGGYVTLIAKKGCKIDEVEITTTNTYATSVGYYVNGEEASILGQENVAKSGTYNTATGLNADSVRILNLGTGSKGRLEIASITVRYNGDAAAVDHYELGGTYQTEFEIDDAFNHDGMKIYMAFDEGGTEKIDLTEGCTFSEPDMTVAGAPTVEISLGTTAITSYDITVAASTLLEPELSYDPTSVTLTQGDALSAPTFNNPHTLSPITYNSSKTAVATVDEFGVITLAGGTGTATITASFAGDATYQAGNATFTITVNEPEEDLTGTWEFATSVAAGDRIIIASIAEAGEVTTLGAQGSSNRGGVTSTVAGTELTPAAGSKSVTLVDAGEGKFALQLNNGSYLYASSNSSNQLKETAAYADNENAKWTFAFDGEGVATITAQGTNSHNVMRYNPNGGSPLFACYTSTSTTGTLVTVYKKDVPAPVYETVRAGLTSGNYYTICYPKAMTDVQGATLWSFVGRDANFAYIEQETATTIEAGKPYIMYATASTVTAVLGTDVASAGVNGAIHGTLDPMVQSDLDDAATDAGNDVYLVIGNELRRATGVSTGSNTLPAQRAYVIVDEISSGVPAPGKKVRKMPMQGQTTTGCELINAAEAPAKMMINGQLFILRGEKKYDATGRLVK